MARDSKGSAALDREDIEQAKEYYLLDKWLREEHGDGSDEGGLARSISMLGWISWQKDRNLDQAKDCYQKEISLYEQIYAEVKTEEFRDALSKVYTKLSEVLSQNGLAKQAAQYAEKAARILEEQACPPVPAVFQTGSFSGARHILGKMLESKGFFCYNQGTTEQIAYYLWR